LRVGAGSRLAKRRPEGGLDAVLASWTMGAEEDDLRVTGRGHMSPLIYGV